MKKVMVCVALLLAFASPAFAAKYYAFDYQDMDRFSSVNTEEECRVYQNISDIQVMQAVISSFQREGFIFMERWSMVDADYAVFRFNKGKDYGKQIIAEARITACGNGAQVVFKCYKWRPYGSIYDFAYPRPSDMKQIMLPIDNIGNHLQDGLNEFVLDIGKYRDYVKLALPRGLGAMHYYGWVRRNRPKQ